MSKTGKRPPVVGVYSQTKISSIGTGTTAKKTEVVSYFFVREREDGSLDVQALGENVVFGPVKQVPWDDFVDQYMPEPQMSIERANADAERRAALTKNLARGDKFYRQGKFFSAEHEYGQALLLDEDNVRANFGIGLCCLSRGDKNKAAEVFRRIVALDAAFDLEHKHLFNQFGIALREGGLYDQALEFYGRAAELSPDDENLLYNMGRAAYDKGDHTKAMEHLCSCQSMNPEHEECRRFLKHLDRVCKLKEES